MGLPSRLICSISVLLYFAASSHGLRCWHCENMDISTCIRKGEMQTCKPTEKVFEMKIICLNGWGFFQQYCFQTCQTEVSTLVSDKRILGHLLPKAFISRTGCKQARACANNEKQNKASTSNSTQCRPGKIGSVCRCCCAGYPCNRQRRNLLCMGKKPRKNKLNDVFPPGLVKARMERTCPDYPAAPKYGNRTCIGGLSFRSYCRFTCDEGATMVGPDMSICVQRGKDYVWNRPSPKCVRNDMCPKMPDAPKSGMKECDGDGEIGTVCSFACRIGFKLRGSSRTTCVQNSAIPEWTNKPPVCIPACDMADVEAPENGRKNCLGEGQLGTTCMFRCNDGYKADGWWVSRCVRTRSGGRWTQSPPKCLAFCADALQAPTQGHMTCSGNGVTGTTCSFLCNENYRIVGAEETVCTEVENGAAWSQEPPTCEPICVSEPRAPNYGRVSCSGRQLGDECAFECHEGFSLVGRSLTSCVRLEETAAWSHESPVCEPTCMMPPPAPMNGKVTCDGRGQPGTVCEYECDIGFRVQGVDAVECVKANEEEAMWSNIPPVCPPICHVMPKAPTFGQVVCNGQGDIGSTCDFICDEEYEMYGEDKMVCQEYGDRAAWSSEAPICKPIPRCEPAKDPQNGHVICDGTGEIGTKCFFSCDTWYRRMGEESAVCVRNGDQAYWNERAVSCKEIEPECAPMGDIVHGEVVCDSDILRKGTTCQFQCTEPGYELLSDNNGGVTCEGQNRSLTWSSKKPCCVECKNVKKDIVIAMDSSGSIGPLAWKNMTRFVQNIIRKFNVSRNDVQFSVFQFSTAARSDGFMFFGRYKKEPLIRQVGKMKRMASGTKTGAALRYAQKRLLDRGNRKDVADMIWVLTDGETEDMAELEKVSWILRRKGVEILALAISPTENFIGQMTKMTGTKDRIMKAESMKSLSDDLVSRIAVKICQESCPA